MNDEQHRPAIDRCQLYWRGESFLSVHTVFIDFTVIIKPSEVKKCGSLGTNTKPKGRHSRCVNFEEKLNLTLNSLPNKQS
ncbi:hypothetical protein RB195_014759 [Necator americanus]|uniref:Uncharacterized protein n=1 Tax=Necator americanus TaxID=51031 RepID=A0ABR1E487_NECAM